MNIMNTTNKHVQTRTALIIGASGLVGGHCLKYLLDSEHYHKVIALVRRPLIDPDQKDHSQNPEQPYQHPKLNQVIIDFDKLDDYRSLIQADDIYCAIGTTVLKSPSRADYTRIDYTYPFEIAKIAFENGATRFALVSALSASPNSLLFYSRVKGHLEDAVSNIPFQGCYIFQPSYLVGDRKEFRLIEKIGVAVLTVLQPLLIGPLFQFRAVRAKEVAFAMVQKTIEGVPGVHIIPSPKIHQIYISKSPEYTEYK